jgi:hypothetical protein
MGHYGTIAPGKTAQSLPAPGKTRLRSSSMPAFMRYYIQPYQIILDFIAYNRYSLQVGMVFAYILYINSRYEEVQQ